MPEPVKIAFQRRVIVLALAEIMPMRSVSASMRQMLKYKRILASIGEVGIVEPLVLAPRNDETEPYMYWSMVIYGLPRSPNSAPRQRRAWSRTTTKALPTTSGLTGSRPFKSTT
jgi:hypothetical protein